VKGRFRTKAQVRKIELVRSEIRLLMTLYRPSIWLISDWHLVYSFSEHAVV